MGRAAVAMGIASRWKTVADVARFHIDHTVIMKRRLRDGPVGNGRAQMTISAICFVRGIVELVVRRVAVTDCALEVHQAVVMGGRVQRIKLVRNGNAYMTRIAIEFIRGVVFSVGRRYRMADDAFDRGGFMPGLD